MRFGTSTGNDKGIMNFNPALDFGYGKTLFAYPNALNKSYTLFYVYKALKSPEGTSAYTSELPFIEMHFNGRIYNAISTFFARDTKFLY